MCIGAHSMATGGTVDPDRRRKVARRVAGMSLGSGVRVPGTAAEETLEDKHPDMASSYRTG